MKPKQNHKVTLQELNPHAYNHAKIDKIIQLRDYYLNPKEWMMQLRSIIRCNKSTNTEKLKAISLAIQLFPELKALAPPTINFHQHDHIIEVPQDWLAKWDRTATNIIDAEGDILGSERTA